MIKILKKILKSSPKNNSDTVFYLKINRQKNYTFACLQKWIDIANLLGVDFYIICDDNDLKKDVLKKIKFKDSNIKIIKSCKSREIKAISSRVANKQWQNAAYAHLTTFFHARENNIKYFWNIDADDTSFLMYSEHLVNELRKIEIYAKENHIAAFSLDMWKSITDGKHWSFGITYIDNTIDWFKLLKEHYDDFDYINYPNVNFNLDCYFTYLNKITDIKFETFYFENLRFIHWGNFDNPIYSGISHWSNGVLSRPYLYPENNTKNNEFLEKIIQTEVIKMGNVSDEEYVQSLRDLCLLQNY